jgi:SAM-dependent methyltransferase
VDSRWSSLHYRNLLAHYYRHLIPPSASVLAAGCGSGELLSLLPNRDVTGIEISPRQAERARQRVPHGTFHVQAGEHLKLDRTFDCIILSETVNFAVDAQAVFEQLHSVSKADTSLILNFHSNLWRQLSKMARIAGIKADHLWLIGLPSGMCIT